MADIQMAMDLVRTGTDLEEARGAVLGVLGVVMVLEVLEALVAPEDLGGDDLVVDAIVVVAAAAAVVQWLGAEYVIVGQGQIDGMGEPAAAAVVVEGVNRELVALTYLLKKGSEFPLIE